ncbi:MAG: glycoside hydrolase family 127 protein [Acidobacteriaceae bacterium]|nr:glycoside hydrolase family 127 protein [Acidobacteriaceae bacterium]MBV9780693.1 glycoside hydrolase family 127 protein [Acidobacteriaceae bacterium]
MGELQQVSRRQVLKRASAIAGFCSIKGFAADAPLLSQFDYSQVVLAPGPLDRQFRENHLLVLSLNEDSLLKPYREREGLPAPGRDMGGWYDTNAFAPGAHYGQWLSALARNYAATGDEATRAKVDRMVGGYAATIDPEGRFYLNNRFPAYTYDKLVCGLIDAHTFAHDPSALDTLARATDAALPHLPEHAMAHRDMPVTAHQDFTEHWWDESYTLPENLFLAWERSGDSRYLEMAKRYLYNDGYFDPLARGENALPGKHAYSHMNCLSSAARAYLELGEQKYFLAARNGFEMVQKQSYATGGWGPNEQFIEPGSGKLGESLISTHASFETPCGSYAHFKVGRYLLRITRDSQYGDSMERVMYNTVLGAKPIQPDGSAFYYSDYNFQGRKVYHPDKWSCCSGTLPQIAVDYRISAYFWDARGVYVNLYAPSTLTWTQAGRQYSIRQTTGYPHSSHIRFEVVASNPSSFSVFFRIPEWASGARLSTKGIRDSRSVTPGQFAEVRKEWKTGDRIELELPLKMRLEAVDEQHPDTVALLCGPLVLMSVNSKFQAAKEITRAALLSARPTSSSSRTWTARSDHEALTLKPFTEINDEEYTTYIRVQSV